MTTSNVGNTPPPPISVDAFISQSAGSSWLGSDGDLASFVMAEQIKHQDNLVSDRLVNVQLQSEARELFSARIAELRQCLADYKEAHDDGEMDASYQMAVPRGGARMDASINRATREVKATWGGTIGSPVGDTGEYRDYDMRCSKDIEVTGTELDGEIKRLEDQCQKLDSNREIEMIQLNSLIGKRGNMVQLLSNISKKQNDTEGAIISNMR